MLSFLDRRPPIEEYRAAFLYLGEVFTVANENWDGIQEALNLFKVSLHPRVHDPEFTVALALLGQNLAAMLNGNTTLKLSARQLDRLETWSLFALLNDYTARTTRSPEQTLADVRAFQAMHVQSMAKKENPFGNVAGALLCEIYRDGLMKLCMPDGSLRPLVHTVIADGFALAANATLGYWKRTLETHRLVEVPFPEGMGL